MNIQNNYGKSPFNPIKLNSIQSSLVFLNSLLTKDDKPFIYQRIQTTSVDDSSPIDCYEVYKANGKREFLFFDCYHENNCSEIPEGFKLFNRLSEPLILNGIKFSHTFGVNYKVKKFPEDLLKIKF